MRSEPIAIDFIDRENFLRFGETVEVLRPDPGRAQRGEDEYKILSRTQSVGWRIAMRCVRTRWTDTLDIYDSRRLLTPHQGTTLLCAAAKQKGDDIYIFLLDRAVVINANIPHCLLTLSSESWVQIGENFETAGKAIKLRKTLVPAAVWD